ncbi:bifunctional glutamate N-acetyltransferase/amino-acid acetyltransferase ArgJ [Sulfurimonas diazotrophicus]|uniref:Arginine biosynthesis bifunctional protein ArgJ n=1 Tax=Sulfurimonas diazotrophicus TaxID=3131939 RepID=A0ABZ3HAH4_9BACT
MFEMKKVGGGVCAPEGFFAGSASAGLRPNGADDVAFIYADTPCEMAAVFTTNKMTAAPIRHYRAKGSFKSNFVLMNAKNANAMTGPAGIADIDEVLGELQAHYGNLHNPVMSSTGVIGVRLPKAKITAAAKSFDLGSRDSLAAAKAIMTTDTFYKMVSTEIVLEEGKRFRLGAIAKGAGMINPAMATMLCFVTTDADAEAAELQACLEAVIPTTFNAASVDGDTSTNDTVMLFSNRKSGAFDAEAFKTALHEMLLELAQMMVSDGEGATKMVTFHVTGAASDDEAETAAKALSNSLLMKTAIYGEDPNWGRVASTIGASGVACDEATLTVSFDDVCVYDKGTILFDAETEKLAAAVMKRERFTISCALGMGEGAFDAYGCDLGHEYVKINADYRT